MNLADVILLLVKEDYVLRWERNPANIGFLAVSVSKGGYTQRGNILLQDFTGRNVANLLLDAKASLDVYLKLRNGG